MSEIQVGEQSLEHPLLQSQSLKELRLCDAKDQQMKVGSISLFLFVFVGFVFIFRLTYVDKCFAYTYGYAPYL
jgi:hypothetical protein